MAPRKTLAVALATLGAQARLQQIDAERAVILKTFPDLRRVKLETVPTLGRKRHMSVKARKAMSDGMRAYWKKRKAAAK